MDRHTSRLSTGIAGLDDILHGGFIARTAYLVRGGPGQGKTTLGLHFLSACQEDETALFIGFQEPEVQLRQNAAKVGMGLERVNFLSLAPDESFFTEQSGYDIFSSSDVEQAPIAEAVIEAVEQHRPSRVFIDSLTQMRFISADVFQYRKTVLSLLHFLKERGITVAFSSESSDHLPDDDLQFMADGVLLLKTEQAVSALTVEKFRGSGFRRGAHQMRIDVTGLRVFPRPLPPMSKLVTDTRDQWSSGIEALDTMLNGGIEAGSVTLITGPAGVGKSTLAACFAAEASRDGSRTGIYLFEEEMSNYLRRANALQVGLEQAQRDGRVTIEQIEPLRYLADEFSQRIRQHIEEQQIKLVVLDSISGFAMALDGDSLQERLHSFVKHLARLGVTVVLVNEVADMGGALRISETGISYLADNVIYLRYMEMNGELTKVMGILKKRLSAFDNACYSYRIGPHALTVGEPVRALENVHNITSMTSGP